MKEALTAAGVDQMKYSGHRFRIGSATSASSCGIQDSLMKIVAVYPDTTLFEVSQKLVSQVQDSESLDNGDIALLLSFIVST